MHWGKSWKKNAMKYVWALSNIKDKRLVFHTPLFHPCKPLYNLYTYKLNHSQTIWDKKEVLLKIPREHIENLMETQWTKTKNAPPFPPPLLQE
jgi:hypothetical protein